MEILWIILAIISLGGALFFLPLSLGAGMFWVLAGVLLVLFVALLVKLIIFLAPIFFILGIILIIWGLIESPYKRMRLEERIKTLVDKFLGRTKYYEGERLRILEMLERGEISYEEAMERIRRLRR